MDPDTSVSDQREQRMLAVAKLKRAASLPRMKDGRRPPMHVAAVSEGEKVNTDDEQKDDADTPPPEVALEALTPAEPEPHSEDAVEDVTEGVTFTAEPATRSKRRSRSRTRSRGSKDFKLKARAALSPTPSPLVPSDSSQDEAASPTGPSLMSPIPSNLAALQRSRLLRSPTPTTPDFSPYYPGTRPPTPNLPSLEELQRGLFRSNSVGSTSAGRIMAMHKLTGGTETYDPSPSPTPPPLPGKLGRNNTVAGGERVAARQFMLSRLGGRIAKEPDGEPASGGEEYTAPSPTPKRKRRRSRRGSAGANTNTGVSDSEFLSTSPNTPVVPPTPLPVTFDTLPDFRAQTTTPIRAASPRSATADQDEEPAATADPSVSAWENVPVEQERPEPTRRRSVVVEDEDEERVPLHTRQPVPSIAPPQPPIYDYGTQPQHLFSDLFTDNSRTSPAPVVQSSRRPTPEYVSRSSPFTIPLQEKQSREEEEEEEVLYAGDSYLSRNGYDDDFERQISWVATP
ncbi:hypothetical protein B0H10DRAFT_1871401, partial [Mycena sp. CBHHK59/15]